MVQYSIRKGSNPHFTGRINRLLHMANIAKAIATLTPPREPYNFEFIVDLRAFPARLCKGLVLLLVCRQTDHLNRLLSPCANCTRLVVKANWIMFMNHVSVGSILAERSLKSVAIIDHDPYAMASYAITCDRLYPV